MHFTTPVLPLSQQAWNVKYFHMRKLQLLSTIHNLLIKFHMEKIKKTIWHGMKLKPTLEIPLVRKLHKVIKW